MVGLVQEQHGERAALFSLWKELDGIIAVDALNQLEVTLVPITLAIDEWGIVRHVVGRREDPNAFVQAFLREEFEPPKLAKSPRNKKTTLKAKERSRQALLNTRKNSRRIEELERHLNQNRGDAKGWFELGVLYRARYDMGVGEAQDFQRAVDAWGEALALNPDQYIWRRRIQQYGPRLAKPYPFYDWVQEATAELGVGLKTPLTQSEISSRDSQVTSRETMKAPTAADRVTVDQEHVAVQSVVVPAAAEVASAVRVYLSFDLNTKHDVHWNHEAQGLQVWWDIPEGVQVTGTFIDPPRTDVAVSEEQRTLEFEVVKPSSKPLKLRGKAFYYICLGEDGACLYRTQPLELEL